MEWYKLLSIFALATCLTSLLFQIVKLIKAGTPADYSVKAGDTTKGIRYSFTGAMVPSKKESAFLHLPVYIAGLAFHGGTFLAAALWIFFTAGITLPDGLANIAAIILAASLLSALTILAKRVFSSASRSISNPDDYISNILVTAFQLFTLFMLTGWAVTIPYYITTTILLLYFPLGKLRHLVFFFAARYHMGYFFGYRGTWPPEKRERD